MLASLLGPDGAWIGLSDILKEGSFTWRDDSPVRLVVMVVMMGVIVVMMVVTQLWRL